MRQTIISIFTITAIIGLGVVLQIRSTVLSTNTPLSVQANLTQTDTLDESDSKSFRVSDPPVPELKETATPVSTTNVPFENTNVKDLTTEAKVYSVFACSGSFSDRYGCYDENYEKIIIKSGVNSAMEDLKERYKYDAFIVSECHQLTHIIGRHALNNFDTVEVAYERGDSFCWSGYYHGVLEAVAERDGVEKFVSNINNVCGEIKGKESYSFDYYNCVHGLGHGVMSLSNHELFESLEMCDFLTDSWEKQSCWSGVFMENIISHNIKNYSSYLKPKEPMYPCTAIHEKYKNTCYLTQTSYALDATNWNFSKVFALCEEAGIYANTCFQSLGRDASGSTISDVSGTKEHCLLGKNDIQKSNCIIGAVKDFISYHHSDTEAKELCASLPEDLQDTCYTTAENYYKIF